VVTWTGIEALMEIAICRLYKIDLEVAISLPKPLPDHPVRPRAFVLSY
jgi:hypothetical protein